MKRLIPILILFFSFNLSAQIQLYQIEPADSTWHILISNDTLGPINNIPMYVPFHDVIGIDTVFRKADSVCFRIPSVPKDLCYFLPDSSTQTLTLLRDGDSIRISISDGNMVAFLDSTRSNADIADVARDSLVVIDSIVNDGDSVRTYMSDGRVFTVRDSSAVQSFYQVGDTVYLDKTDSYFIDHHIDSVWHKGDSVIVRTNKGHRWSVLDKIGGDLDTVYFDGGDLCIQYTDLTGPTLICTPVDIPGDDWGNQVVEIAGDNISGDGTSGNPLTVNKQDLQSVTDKGNTTTNPVKFLNDGTSNPGYNTYELAHKGVNGTGAIVIRFPAAPNSTIKFEISLSSYYVNPTPARNLTYHVWGRINAGAGWSGDRITSGVIGSAYRPNTSYDDPVPSLRFATDGNGDPAIIIGDTSSRFFYTHVSITRLESVMTNEVTDATIELATSEAEFTSIREPILNENISVDMLDGQHGDYYIQEIFKLGDTIRLSETGYYVLDKYRNAIGGENLITDSRFREGGVASVRRFISSGRVPTVEMVNGAAKLTSYTGSSHPILRYEFEGLNVGRPYVLSYMTDWDKMMVIGNHQNVDFHELATVKLNDSTYVHYNTFTPTDSSGRIYNYFQDAAPSKTFWLYWMQLQEGDAPTMWHPANDDIAGEIIAEITPDMIDTIIHIGDSIRVELNSGDSYTVRDSFLTPEEITQIARDSLPHVGTFHRSGDSIYLTLTDGTTLPVRDSFVDLAGVRDSIQNNIDSIAAHRIDIDEITDTLGVHRTDINQNITDISILNDSIDQHRIDIDAISEVEGFTHIGDSIRLELTDGRIFTVRDSFISKEDVAQIARDSIEIPDMVNVYNSDGSLTSHRVVDVDGKSLRIVDTIINNPPQKAIATFEVSPTLQGFRFDIENVPGQNSTGIYSVSGQGILILDGQYAPGSYPMDDGNYFLKLVNNQGRVAYMPVVQVSDFTRSGDSLHLTLDDGNTLAVRDSFLTPGDIMDVIGDSLEIVTVQDFYRDGDSVRLELSDGTKWAVLDSFVNLSGIRDTLDIHQDSIASYDQRILTLNDSIAAHRQDIDGNTVLIQDHIDDDDDLDPTNEIQGFGNYSNPSGESGLVKLENNSSGVGLKLSGSGGVDVDASFDGNDVVMTIDASSIDGNTNLTSSKVGNNVTINSSTGSGTTFSVADGDSDNTNELQDLTRTGDIIGLSNSVATTLDRNVTAITHTGDSVKFTTSDGREFVVRDSVLSKDTVLSWVDDTSIYTHDGTIQDGLRTVSIPDTAKLRFDMESGAQFELNSGEKGRMIYRTGALPIYPFFGLYNYNDATEDSTSFVANPFAIALQAWSGEDNHHRIELSKSLQAISITTTARDTDLDLKRYFIHSSSQGGGGIAFDSLRLTDIGISAADTARWGQGGLSGLNPDEVVYGGQDGQAAQTANFNYKDGALQVGTTSKTGHRLSMHASPTLATGQDTSIIHISGNSAGSNQGQVVNGLRVDWNGNVSNSRFKGVSLNYTNTSGDGNYGILMEGIMKLTGGFVNPRSLILNTELTNGLHATRTFYGVNNTLKIINPPVSSSHGTTYEGFRNVFESDAIIVPNTAGSNASIVGYHSIMNFNEVDNKAVAQGLRVTFGGTAASSMTNLYGIYQHQNFVKNYFAGSIGIGTSAPTQKLDVNGDVRFRWHLYDAYNNNGSGFSNAVLSRDAGGIRWRSETNYYQSFTSYTNPTSTSGLARLSNTSSGGLRLEGSGGVDVDASFNGTDIVMSIDGSGVISNLGGLSSVSNPTSTSAIARMTYRTNNQGLHFKGTGGIDIDGAWDGTDVSITVDGSSLGSNWTTSGSNIYRNSGVSIGTTSTTNNTFRIDMETQINNGNELHFYSNGSRGRLYASSSGLNIVAQSGNDLFLSGSGGVLVSGGPMFVATIGTTFTNNVLFGGMTRYEYSTSNTESIYVMSSSGSLGSADNGTLRIVLNNGAGNITVEGVTIAPGKGQQYIRYGSSWYAMQ